jgi:HEXXH motif-containing protein
MRSFRPTWLSGSAVRREREISQMGRFPHGLSDEAFAALSAGGGGPTAIEQLAAAEHSKHLLLLAGIMKEADEVGHEESLLAAEGFSLLHAVSSSAPQVAERVITHPSVGAWATRTMKALRGAPGLPGATPSGLRAVAAAAAISAGHQAEITIGAADGLAMLPTLGAAVVSGGSALVRSADGSASVGPVEVPEDPHRDGPGWLGLRRVRAGALDVLIDDLDPFRYPAGSNLAAHQDGDAWAEKLTESWAMLEAHHPAVAAEVAAAVRVITPLVVSSGDAESSSSPEVFGTVAMSMPMAPVSGAEALAHEVQHVKLGALLDLVELVKRDDGSRYYAPWRPDPRPAGGLLQGAYAYLGVSRFWRRQRLVEGYREHGDAEYARWRAAAATVVATLRSSNRLTGVGFEFVTGMARTLAPWQLEPVSAKAQANADRAAAEHLARWQSAHGAATTD